MLVGDLLMRGS